LYNLLEFLDPVKFNQTFRDNLNTLRTEKLQAKSDGLNPEE